MSPGVVLRSSRSRRRVELRPTSIYDHAPCTNIDANRRRTTTALSLLAVVFLLLVAVSTIGRISMKSAETKGAVFRQNRSPVTRGDPTSPLRWTCKSRAKLAAALTEQRWRVSSTTVGRLVHRLGYRLQSPRNDRKARRIRTATRSSSTSTGLPTSI